MDNTLYFSHRDKRANISELQSYLRYISRRGEGIPNVVPDGIYGQETKNAVSAFQKKYGIPVTGDADFETWTRIVEEYDRVLREEGLPNPVFVYPVDIPYLKEGDSFEEIYILQVMLRRIAKAYGDIHMPKITGVFDGDTRRAVEDVSSRYEGKRQDRVDRELWNIIADIYSAFTFVD